MSIFVLNYTICRRRTHAIGYPARRGVFGFAEEGAVVHCERPNDNSRVWKAPDGLHIALRGLEPPEPMVAVLQLIDRGDVETALIAHFDREPIFL